MQGLGYSFIDKKLGTEKNSEGTVGCCYEEDRHSLKGEIVFGAKGSD